MGDPLQHARSSADKFGGRASDYIELHQIMDSSKLFLGDWRHRSVLHNTFGVYLMENYIIGPTFERESDSEEVCTRTVCNQHIVEDLNMVPTLGEFLREMPLRRWMQQATPKEIERLKTNTIGEETQVPGVTEDVIPETRVSASVVWVRGSTTPQEPGEYLIDFMSAPSGPSIAVYNGDGWTLPYSGIVVATDWEPKWWAEIPMDPVLDDDPVLVEHEAECT